MLLKKLVQIKNKPKTWVSDTQVLGVLIFLGFCLGMFFPVGAGADEISELKSKISEKSLEMEELEEDIEKWEKEIEVVGQEKQSLNRDLRRLDTTQKKLNSGIYLTGQQINTAGLKIEKLGIEIGEREIEIQSNSSALVEAIRTINEKESYSLLESMLTGGALSEFWNDLEGLQRVQAEIKKKTNTLKNLKVELTADKVESEQEKKDLSSYKIKLADQKVIVEDNQVTKNQLLAVTKNKESNYQVILDEKKILQQKLETELRDFEAQLEYIADKSRLPKKGSGVLIFPLKNPRITQFFGLTPFALTGAYGYKDGKPNPHRGIDFGVSIGTPMLATASGTVRDFENMDAYPGCVSYGKWILIDHDNGLSTLYAHLSLIKVKRGQRVNTGDLVGYSGNSGYSTGPHLHFSVFDGSAVKVGPYTWSRGCKKVKIAYAPLDAYLDPMDYFPEY